ncbi:hypothetical protein BH10CYA1_BH10CYA1_64400 [soil metagenome]
MTLKQSDSVRAYLHLVDEEKSPKLFEKTNKKTYSSLFRICLEQSI